MDIESLIIFRTVVEAGSFTAAGHRLEKDKAHISRVVSRLERRLGHQLLQRSTRRLRITEIGRELYERALGILTALEETEASMARAHAAPRGLLRVTAGSEFGSLRVTHWMAAYLKRYPEVKIAADFTNRLVDVIHEGIDVAIRVGALPDSELAARTLGEIRYGLYAHPDYIKARGAPEHPEDLNQHRLIMFAPRGRPVWPLANAQERCDFRADAMCSINNNLAAMNLAQAALGITLLPRFQAAPALAAGKLQHIMTTWERVPVPVSALFTSSRFMAPKVRAFVDLAIADFKASEGDL